PYFPWCSLAESNLVDWLASSGLSKAKIDSFLQLEWTRDHPYLPSFPSASNMFERIETSMPTGPDWFKTEITLLDAPTEPQTFFYRDIIDCAKFLYSNPSFQ
ncbi:uncharacterized protein EI90DRAFT_2868868, partial [Cantharellus anzutake]|uniref:uncharacterized protein n=1 Tax=Cantharellus anzutake TaxID=1750568 RepID=UPI001904AF3F